MEEIITTYNKQSLSSIKSQNYQQAFQQLMKCLKLIDSVKDTQMSYRLLLLTYSNFSALYKSTNNLKESNKFLQKIIETEKKIPGPKHNTINAYLSLCSNYSLLSNHEVALRNGLTALIILQKIFPLPDPLVSTLVIAYHNTGVEYEYLGRTQEAVDNYYKGWTIAKSRLGLNNSLTLSIKNSFIQSSGSNKLPVVARVSSQYGGKRLELNQTGSTDSSGLTELRNNTPRQIGKRRLMSSDRGTINLLIQRNNEKNAAVRIQAWWRGLVQRKKFREAKLKFQLKKAAIKAKAAYNEFKNLKEEVLKKNKEIPKKKEEKKTGYKAKSKSQHPPQVSLDPVTVLSVPLDLSEKFYQIRSKKNEIQNLKTLLKKKYPISLQQYSKLHLESIVKAQSFIRMIVTRAKYQKILSAIIIIQKNFRMYLCFKVFKTISKSLQKVKFNYNVYRKKFLINNK